MTMAFAGLSAAVLTGAVAMPAAAQGSHLTAALHTQVSEAATDRSVVAQQGPAIPEPEGMVNGGEEFDSVDFWQNYLTGLGLAGVTCATDDPAGAGAYTLKASAAQGSSWVAAVLVSASGADQFVDYGDSLIKLEPYPTIGQEYRMLFEEDYYLQLSNVILCQADLEDTTTEPPVSGPIVETDMPDTRSSMWTVTGAAVVALLGAVGGLGGACVLHRRRSYRIATTTS